MDRQRTNRPAMDWQDLLTQLEAKLTQLQDQGIRHLNIAQDSGLAEELQAIFGPQAQAAPETTSSTGGAADEASGPGFPAKSRAAGLAASLKEGHTPPEAESGQVAESPNATHLPLHAPAESATPAPIAKSAAPEQIDSLEALAFQYRDCMACGLGATRNRLVFGAGDGRARLLFLGEGPGAEEDQQGLPFVGRAGALLTGLIQALGLTREDVYITNVVKCRPPGNRNPQPDESAACHPILMRQIELIDPALIVTLGNVPLKALNPNAGGITRARGKPFAFGRWQVLPTFHPSYLLRNPAGLKDCWSDFKHAFNLALAGEAP